MSEWREGRDGRRNARAKRDDAATPQLIVDRSNLPPPIGGAPEPSLYQHDLPAVTLEGSPCLVDGVHSSASYTPMAAA